MADRIIVTVRDDWLPRIDALADRLRAAGMLVEQVLQPVGVITGSVPRSQWTVIQALPGVASVEDETAFQHPPPDAGIQ